MSTNRIQPWPARLGAFAVAALCAGSAVFWFLQWQPQASARRPPDAGVPAQTSVSVDAALLAQRLGAKAASISGQQLPPSNGLRLLGVVADSQGKGSAVIAVDGKPTRSYQVGSRVTDSLVLQSVQPRKALLASDAASPASVTIELPASTKPAP